ncbi:MAG TPA: LuxR C-terminal-related transcriptional regulator [Microbacteriaceae bacterium]
MTPPKRTVSSRTEVATVSANSAAVEKGLRGLARVLAAPLSDVAAQLSTLVATYLAHSELVLLAEDDVVRPQKQHGDEHSVTQLAFSELDTIRSTLTPGTVRRDVVPLADGMRRVLVALADTGALLLLTNPGHADARQADPDSIILQLWQIIALRIQQRAREASPNYLMESRAASSVRAEAITEITDLHSTTLDSLLAVLRSTNLDDRAARQMATNLAAAAMVELRTASDRVRTFTDEPVSTAFERLQDDLRPLVRYRDIDVQFVEPPVDGRALPSEIAHGARAVVRGAILALVDQPDVGRVRVQWDCDGKNLLINVRDDGPGDLSTESLQLRRLRQRVLAVNGELTLDATEGWGSEMSVVMPLDPPPVRGDDSVAWNLSPRELDVLKHLIAGQRNRAIAGTLGISENTVKFHISKILRKLGVTSRAEAAALALDRRIPNAG